METENNPGIRDLEENVVPDAGQEDVRQEGRKIDLKKLVIYSEIMSPKFKEQETF